MKLQYIPSMSNRAKVPNPISNIRLEKRPQYPDHKILVENEALNKNESVRRSIVD